MTTPIQIERRIAAPPASVYQYLVDPELLQAWFGIKCTLESRPGGTFEMLSPNGMTASGEVVDVLGDRKISFTWGWQGHPAVPPGSSLVEIELIPDGDGTLVRLTHSGLELDEHPLHRLGWEHYLPRLATIAVGGEPGPDPGVT